MNRSWKSPSRYLPSKISIKVWKNLNKPLKQNKTLNSSKKKLRQSKVNALEFMSLYLKLREITMPY